MKRWIKKAAVLPLLLSLALAVLLTLPAQAVEFTNDGSVPAGTVIDDDLFIDANRANIAGTVNGDLFINSQLAEVSGVINGNLIVNSAGLKLTGQVNGSLIFSGQGADIDGVVNGTIYAASNFLRLGPQARIERNVFYSGYALVTLPGSEIQRDLGYFGYQIQHGGHVQRDISASVAAIELSGQIGRHLRLEVDAPGELSPFIELINKRMPALPGSQAVPMIASGMQIAKTAQIGGQLLYTSPVEQAQAIQSAPQGGVTFQQLVVEADPTETNDWLAKRFRELATLLILGGLAVGLLPLLMPRLAAQTLVRPLGSLGRGLLVVIFGHVLSFILFLVIIIVSLLLGVVTLDGLSGGVLFLGLFGLATGFVSFILLLLYGSKLVVALAIGMLFVRRFIPSLSEHRYWPMIIGVVIFIALRMIPILGEFVALLAMLIGMGAIWITLRHSQNTLPAV